MICGYGYIGDVVAQLLQSSLIGESLVSTGSEQVDVVVFGASCHFSLNFLIYLPSSFDFWRTFPIIRFDSILSRAVGNGLSQILTQMH